MLMLVLALNISTLFLIKHKKLSQCTSYMQLLSDIPRQLLYQHNKYCTTLYCLNRIKRWLYDRQTVY